MTFLHPELIFDYECYRHLVGLFGRGNQTVSRPLPTRYSPDAGETQTSLPCIGVKPTIPGIQRMKTFHTLQFKVTTTTVTGKYGY
jgi:hypothetical protein